MITRKETVHAALNGICGDVIYGDPRDFAVGERICWRQSNSRCHARADGQEHLAELEYSLEIYAATAERAAELLAVADGRMNAKGFRRQSAVEQFEADAALSHISARYRALADAEGNMYQ